MDDFDAIAGYLKGDDAADLADCAAEALAGAMDRAGIIYAQCEPDEDDDVYVTFGCYRDAETLLSLAIDSDRQPGSLADRASEGCLTQTQAADRGGVAAMEEFMDALAASWTWSIHPDITRSRVDWHVSVSIPHLDAMSVAASLNSLPKGRGR